MKKPDIVVAVYVSNEASFDVLKACLASVIAKTHNPYRLILIDDASPFQATFDYLTTFVARNADVDIQLLKNEKNLGFLATANRGLFLNGDQDAVILNMDTEVTTGWLERLIHCSESQPNVGTVTPLSNNATLLSIPECDVVNAIPEGYSLDEVAQVVLALSPGLYPEIPTSHGFCMYIRREALDIIGGFDEINFGRGYGEENDFACRCIENGFVNLADDLTFVYHIGEVSFQGEKAIVSAERLKRLFELHPYLRRTLQDHDEQDPLKQHRALFRDAFRRGFKPKISLECSFPKDQKTVLFVNVKGGKHNGLNRYTQELVDALSQDLQIIILEGHAKSLTLKTRHGRVMTSVTLAQPLDWNNSISNKEYAAFISLLFTTYKIDLVQINSFESHAFDLVSIAKQNNIPIVYVIHDFLLLCPSLFLIDSTGGYCGTCSFSDEREGCLESNPYAVYGQGNAAVLHRFRTFVRDVLLPQIDIFVAPSLSAKKHFSAIYDSVSDRAVVIPHIAPKKKQRAPSHRKDNEPLRVGFLGALHPIKGLNTIEEVMARVDSSKFIFTAYGTLSKDIPKLINQGEYHYSTISETLAVSDLDLICIFPTIPETYSYTLSEAAAAGIPVLGTNLGAVGERIANEHLGWTVDTNNVDAIVQILIGLQTNKASLNIPPRHESGSSSRTEYRYLGIYRDLWLKRDDSRPLPRNLSGFFRLNARDDEMIKSPGDFYIHQYTQYLSLVAHQEQILSLKHEIRRLNGLRSMRIAALARRFAPVRWLTCCLNYIVQITRSRTFG